MTNRRDFVKTFVAGGAAALFVPAALVGDADAASVANASARPAPSAPDPWAQVPAILKRIKAPAFPKRDFNVTRFGAVADAKTDCTGAIRKAIDAAHAAGGGRV